MSDLTAEIERIIRHELPPQAARAIAALIAEREAEARRKALEKAAPLVRFALLAGDLLDAMAGDGIEIEGENDPAVVLGELMEAIRPGSEWHEARAIIRALAEKEKPDGQ